MMENQGVSWVREVGETLARMVKEESVEGRKALALGIVSSWKAEEKISVEVAFLCELVRSASTREEVGAVIEIASKENLLVAEDSTRIDPSLKSLVVIYKNKAYRPINPQDRRLQALAKSIRQAFSRIKLQASQEISQEVAEEMRQEISEETQKFDNGS